LVASADLAGRVALVTGGGWNIGRAVALALGDAGAAVAVVGRNADRLEETVTLLRARGARGFAFTTDARRPEEVLAMRESVTEELGPVDVLAAIAGGGGLTEPYAEVDPLHWWSIVETNLKTSFLVSQALTRSMQERGSGSIIFCAGGGATVPMPVAGATAYASAKAGICRLTDQLAFELLNSGVRVNCIEPGRVTNEEEARPTAELATWLASDASRPLTARILYAADDWWRDPARVEEVSASHHLYCLRRCEE